MLSQCRSIDWFLTFFKLICLGCKRGTRPGLIIVGRLHNLPLLCPRIDHLFFTVAEMGVLDPIDEVDPDFYLYRVLWNDCCRTMDLMMIKKMGRVICGNNQ